MVKLNPDQNDDRSKTKTDFDLKKAFDNNNNANTPDPCLAEIHSSNEDDDVYLNVSFNNNSTSNSTDSLSKHKTFNRNERFAKADGGSDGHCSTSENTNEVSSDEIYENYCTAPSTNGPSKLVKVETNGSNNTKTFTKHGINNGKALGNGTLPKDIHTDNSAISDSCSHSSDGANDVTTSSANTVVNDEPDDNVYENIETIREAINKSKTYKKNSNGNRFANENLLVINERKPRQDAINRSASMCATNGDKSDGKTKNHSRSRAR
ncbi:hypothetical protein M8J77_005409 [Diaphorina citri]|nr:hypothetical protein M8J77_005409 [Diaphorina citri]